METISPTGMGMEDMLTLYSIDGDSIVLVQLLSHEQSAAHESRAGHGRSRRI